MAEESQADPKFYNGWTQTATNSNDGVLQLRSTIQSGSGPSANQPFVPYDNAFYHMAEQVNQMAPNDMMYRKSLPEHNNPLSRNAVEESVCDQNLTKNGSGNDVSDAFSQEQFLKFKSIIIKGCESAEHLAYFHRNRPCFKKINCLCARLKQDVDRADSVLANINSQGVPWAVKDFIFVFTRIVSAWNIIKDYVYNNSDGMRSIKSAISDRLVVSFLKWQEVTSDFVEDLTKSFDGLQELTLSQTRNGECQKNIDSKTNSNDQKNFISDTESFDSFKVMASKERRNERSGSDQSSDSSIGYTLPNVKPLSSIGADRKFEYIKTGIYKCTVARNANQFNGNDVHRPTMMEHEQLKRQNVGMDAKKTSFANPMRNMAVQQKCHNQASADAMEMNVRKNPKSELLTKVCFIEESKFFFSSQFTKNYFPDFLKIVPGFIDLRSIIVKSEMEVLGSIYEVVQQIRQIFSNAKIYLMERPHELLDACVAIFEREFENLLVRDFPEYDFKRTTRYDF